MNMREEVIDWLRDAYAMESGLEVSLRRQAEALVGAWLRTLERAARAVDGAEPAVRDVAGLAVLDARALLNRAHGLRRRTEQLR